MTDKEAIRTLKDYIEDLMEDYGYHKDIIEFRDSVEHLEKTIQKQQEEIEYQKEINNTEKDRHNQTEKSLKGQIEKKDKIIDLMADWFEEWAEFIDEENYYTIFRKMSKEDIKEYFKKKVENK